MASYKVEICGVNTAKLPILKEEEKDALFARIKQGDNAARETYIKGNLRLVLSVIKRFSGNHENVDDLFQIGCIGLIKSIDNFDPTIGVKFYIPPVLFFILTIILVWAAINVTNCSDGVDGLSGTLTIITLVTIYVIDQIRGNETQFPYIILLFVVCILGYLWYNATPSRLMMGDAGSRAMGIFISLAVLKTGSPFLFLLVALILILDGGLGLVKVALLRFLKIHIFANTTMPLHDHVRKKIGWSNTQTVFRFAIIQIVISIATVYMILIQNK